ncbi:HAD hydrolase-like protein [Akkermansiaceae bacterium]|nr:HAD hydrolase-like protein [Akkermansiaceae bacterium]
MRYRALIFDFDGTIADTLDEALKVYNKLATDYGLRSIDESELPFLRTLSLSEFKDHMKISTLQIPKMLFQGTRLLKASIPNLKMIEGMKEALITLRENTDCLGILTSNSVENVNLFLETHDLADIFDFATSTSKITGKSRYLKRILKEYSLKAHELIYIGDETRDVVSAKKAKVPVAAVTFGFNAEEALIKEEPTYLCRNPEDLVLALS